MFVGSSLFPAISVNLLHHIEGDTLLTSTRTVRGVVLPLITLGSGGYVDPKVPSPNYHRLTQRLAPTLNGHGVVRYRIAAALRRPP